MSGRGIYLLRGEEELLELRAEQYVSEEILQALVARFPAVLAGDGTGAGTSQRWLLLGREAALPDAEDAGGRWSVDHLFLDQEAVPTLVEVKLARDTRIRREVVGQMLDYAANAVVYWPVERLRELFVRECERAGEDPDALVAEVAGAELDVEAFWERAHENLRAGKLRLVFVCDRIPHELRRVIEFLNGQMSAEVIGIEVRQYVAEGMRTLVPTLVGQTAEAEARKGRSPRRTREWDEQSFFAALAEKRAAAEVAVARALYQWTEERGWRQVFGAGAVEGTWLHTFHVAGRAYAPIAVKTYGSILVRFEFLRRRPPFEDKEMRLRLLQLINGMPGVSIGAEAVDGFSSVPLSTLAADQDALERLKRALEWVERTAETGQP